MNHAEYQKKISTYTVEMLKYVIADATAAMKANPENPKNGFYADEVCYCAMELRRRTA